MKSGYKFNPRILLSLFFAAVALYAIVVSSGWPPHTRIFPQMAAGGLLVFSLVQVVKDVFGPAGPGARIMDFQFAEGIDPDVARRRMALIWGWLLGLPLAIWLIGFSFAIPLVTFAYLKFQGKEGWLLSVALAAAAYLFYFGLFEKFLHIPTPDPFLFRIFS
jgi:hypothetical protein